MATPEKVVYKILSPDTLKSTPVVVGRNSVGPTLKARIK